MPSGDGCFAEDVAGEQDNAVEMRRCDWAALDQEKQNIRKPRMDSWVRTEFHLMIWYSFGKWIG
jgi:hypothetical protein